MPFVSENQTSLNNSSEIVIPAIVEQISKFQIPELQLMDPVGNAEKSAKYGILITVNGTKFGVMEKDKEITISHNGMPQGVESVSRIKVELKSQIQKLIESIGLSEGQSKIALQTGQKLSEQNNKNQILNIQYLDAYKALLEYFETKFTTFEVSREQLNYMRSNYTKSVQSPSIEE